MADIPTISVSRNCALAKFDVVITCAAIMFVMVLYGQPTYDPIGSEVVFVAQGCIVSTIPKRLMLRSSLHCGLCWSGFRLE
jgi:hypothetical protein